MNVDKNFPAHSKGSVKPVDVIYLMTKLKKKDRSAKQPVRK